MSTHDSAASLDVFSWDSWLRSFDKCILVGQIVMLGWNPTASCLHFYIHNSGHLLAICIEMHWSPEVPDLSQIHITMAWK